MTPIILPSEDRFNTKQQMVDLRTAHFGICYCDLCHREHGWDLHEMITRKMTVKQEDLRRLSFQPEICAILCQVCHEHRATTLDGAIRLFKSNIGFYSFERVKGALYKIPESFWGSKIRKSWRVIEEEYGY